MSEDLQARITSLEIQLARSKREIEQQRDEFLKERAKASLMLYEADDRIAELEQQLAVLVESSAEVLSVLDKEGYASQLNGAECDFRAVLAAAKRPANPEPADDCRRCTGTGLVEDAGAALHLAGNGFMPCPDCTLAEAKKAEVMFNGLTDAETTASASVAGQKGEV